MFFFKFIRRTKAFAFIKIPFVKLFFASALTDDSAEIILDTRTAAATDDAFEMAILIIINVYVARTMDIV